MKPEQKELLSSIFDNALDAVLLMDSEGVITGWNKQAEQIFGWYHDEAVGRLMHETIVPQRFREAHVRGMHHFLSTGVGPVLDTRIEIFALHRDGREFPVELTISPIKTADGYEFSSFIRDISERKNMLQQLEEREELFRAVFEQAPNGVELLDPSTLHFVEANPAACRMMGYTHDEYLQLRLADTQANLDEAVLIAKIQQGKKTGGQTTFENRHRCKNGDILDVEVSVRELNLADKHLMIAVWRDITESKRAQDALRESEEKLRNLYELSPLGIALTDMKGRYVEFNEAFQRICGYTREELNALDYWTLTPKKYEAQEAQQLDSLSRTGRYGTYEKEYVRKDGSLVPLSLNGILITGRDGEKYIWSIVKDITESKKAEEEQRIAAIAFESQEGMVVTDVNGIILRVNQAFTRLTGYSTEEVQGKTPAILQSGFQDKEFYQNMWHALKQKHYWRGELKNKHKNGNIYIELLTISAVKTPDGTITHFIGSFTDITERKKMEKEILDRRNEMEFLQKQHIAAQTAAAIAHELNQPLLSVASYSEAALLLMNAEEPDLDKIRSAIVKCEQQAQRAGQSIRELIATTSTKEFPSEAFDLNMEIFDVINTAKAEHELQFHPILQLEHGLPLIRANRTHVQKVLFNLLHNSIDAMLDAGVPLPAITVTVRTMKNESIAQVTVRDNGPGIKNEDFHRLFEPFFTTKEKGIGMGLAISRSLIEENGGQLWIDPQEGPGATFHLTLPFAISNATNS